MAPKPRKRSNTKIDNSIFEAIDLMLAGHDTLIGHDFIMTRRDNSEIGHLDPSSLHTYDQDFVSALINFKPLKKIKNPGNLDAMSENYTKQRELIGDYHLKIFEKAMDFDIQSAKELGNFDRRKVIIRNDPEMNVFFDYISLYRKINKVRSAIHWNSENSHFITEENYNVVKAYEDAKFALLRIDKNIDNVAMRTTNIITGTEYILMDRALNRSKKEGHFFICSTINMNNYIMTTGGGIPISPNHAAGKSTLSLFQKHLSKVRGSDMKCDDSIVECVREIYGFCLRSGAMAHMTIG